MLPPADIVTLPLVAMNADGSHSALYLRDSDVYYTKAVLLLGEWDVYPTLVTWEAKLMLPLSTISPPESSSRTMACTSVRYTHAQQRAHSKCHLIQL
jgi:hypothetical protein